MTHHEGSGRLVARLLGVVVVLFIGLAWSGLHSAAAVNQVDVSAQVSVTRSGFVYNRTSQTYDTTVTLENISQT